MLKVIRVCEERRVERRKCSKCEMISKDGRGKNERWRTRREK